MFDRLMKKLCIAVGGVEPVKNDIEDYIVNCCNPDCGWTGLYSQCLQMKYGFPKGLCPECHEVTEPNNGP